MTAPACQPGPDPSPPGRLTLRARARDYYRRLMECPGQIEEVAGGFALGVFWGFSPWQGFHFLLTIAFCALLRRNMAAGVIGATVFNAFTALPIFAIELELGLLLTGQPPLTLSNMSFDFEGMRRLMEAGKSVFIPYLIGSLVVGSAAAAVSYFWLKGSLKAYRERVYLRRHHGPDA